MSKNEKDKPKEFRKGMISSSDLSKRPNHYEGMISSSDLNRSPKQIKIGQDRMISSSELQNKSQKSKEKK